jgi:NADH-quinone oxidoreductase subunit J
MPLNLTMLALYGATVLGAVALVLMLPKPGPKLGLVGAVVGSAGLGALWLAFSPFLSGRETGLSDGAFPFYYVFSGLAIASAVRVITHTRAVYAALWFVMVVIASAGLFLTLEAEFMALAMLIIYGGAILVTYMFVIMLASQPQASDDPADQPEFERFAREPLWASVAGFIMLAAILSVVFDQGGFTPNPLAAADIAQAEATLADRPIAGRDPITGLPAPVPIGNVELVGLNLFEQNPLAIELAGVILLLSLVGAVVIAKTKVKGEEEQETGIRRQETGGGRDTPAFS